MDNYNNEIRYVPAKKGLTGGTIAILLVVCVLVSALCGFGGAFAANYLLEKKGSGVETNDAPSVSAPGSAAVTTVVETDISKVAKKSSPTVVEITTEAMQSGGFFGQYVTTGAGSGVIISEDGYIVTCEHVVSGANSIKVVLNDKTEYSAELIGSDAASDLAVIKIDAKGLQPATIADSDALVVGEPAVAIGNPLGSLGGTVTNGIISSLSREVTVGNQNMTLLQTNAAVNPGNSGGGLFNLDGDLIGIVNAKSAGEDIEGLGFAIPSNTVKKVSDSIVENGYVAGRPALGVTVVEVLDEETAAQYNVTRYGVYIYEVTSGKGADKAGLEPKDYIVSVDDTAIEYTADISGIISKHEVGDVVTVQIIRDNKTMSFDVTLGEAAKA